MEADAIERIRRVASALDRHIAVLSDLGLTDAVMMLGMARLDLEARINSISDDEFAEFCRALEKREADRAAASRRRTTSRSTRHCLLNRRHKLSKRKGLG
jgi:hypothetical protein